MTKLKVFYMPKMAADVQSFSPSSAKPRMIAERLSKSKHVEFMSFKPLTRHDLYLSHDQSYVNDVLTMKRANGFGTKSESVARSLLYTTAAEYHAASEALNNGRLAWALCSGFHHANYDHGGGYCTFEGLTITLQKLRAEGRIKNALIIDGDAHYGDGCVDVIKKRGLAYIRYISIANKQNYEEILRDQISKHDSIVLFQDGMDAYKFDPLGGSPHGLTYEELVARNIYVTEKCLEYNVPLCINLAGGYTRATKDEAKNSLEPVIAGHINSIVASASLHGIPLKDEFDITRSGPWEKRLLKKASRKKTYFEEDFFEDFDSMNETTGISRAKKMQAAEYYEHVMEILGRDYPDDTKAAQIIRVFGYEL